MADELLNSGMAAKLLSELIPDRTSEQWTLWLQNNRNKSRRAAYRIPVEKLGGGVFYSREEIARFAEFEKSRKLGAITLTGRAAEVVRAFGIGTAGGSTTGRKMGKPNISLQIDEATRERFIQFAISNPLMVYRLELDEAKFIAQELTELLNYCVRSGGGK